MEAAIQQRIKPHEAPRALDFSDAKVAGPVAVTDGDAASKVSFKDLLMNANVETVNKRAAQQNGNGLEGAKTDDEFRKMLSDRANKDLLRKPQNDLDKDSFLKLFVTQMQNQDPLNPDDSSQMAAQLAQFNGLEQMLNVNKNLEKMQTEQSLSRNLSLLGFVGKEVRLDGGKVKVEGGKLTDASFRLEKDAPRTKLEVRDAAGVLVGTKDMGQMRSGEHKLDWDGKGLDGKAVPNGVYTFTINAKDLNDQDLPVKISSVVKVTGVDLKDGSGSFYTELGRVRIGEVSTVGEESFAVTAQAADAVGEDAARSLKAASEAVDHNEGGVPPSVMEAALKAAGARSASPNAPGLTPPGMPAGEQPGGEPQAQQQNDPGPRPPAVGTAIEIPFPAPSS